MTGLTPQTLAEDRQQAVARSASSSLGVADSDGVLVLELVLELVLDSESLVELEEGGAGVFGVSEIALATSS